MDVEGLLFAPALQCPFGTPAPLMGACCMGDGTCEAMTLDGCAAMGGEHMGEATTCQESAICDPDPLPAACCLVDGACVDLTEADCVEQAGELQPGGVLCDDLIITCPQPCPADIDGDGAVTVADLVAVITAWGTDDPAADVDGDGIVGVDDLIAVIAAWGVCP